MPKEILGPAQSIMAIHARRVMQRLNVPACNREFNKVLRRRRRLHRLKTVFYLTYESWDTLKSLTLFITVKAIAKLNLEHCNKFEIEIVHVLQTTQNWSFHVVVLQRTAKKCTRSYNACAEPFFLLIKPFV